MLSPTRPSPTAVVAVYYNIGFRVEPRDRTGFAHLFEHLMFQGSQNLGKLQFIGLVESNGGILNGSTRFDFTNYFEVVPTYAFRPFCGARPIACGASTSTRTESDEPARRRENEVKVNVLNEPYGGFPWLDLPQVANTNWYNAHNFYGDFARARRRDAGGCEQVLQTYYAPNNAALVVTGDIDPAQTLAWIEEYFGAIPSAPVPPQPDVTSRARTQEKRVNHDDPLATRPALASAITCRREARPSGTRWA